MKFTIIISLKVLHLFSVHKRTAVPSCLYFLLVLIKCVLALNQKKETLESPSLTNKSLTQILMKIWKFQSWKGRFKLKRISTVAVKIMCFDVHRMFRYNAHSLQVITVVKIQWTYCSRCRTRLGWRVFQLTFVLCKNVDIKSKYVFPLSCTWISSRCWKEICRYFLLKKCLFWKILRGFVVPHLRC